MGDEMTVQTMRPTGSEPLRGPGRAFRVALEVRSVFGHASAAPLYPALAGASS